MKFDLSAAKAYMGAVLAGAAVPVAHWLIGLVDAGIGTTLPSGFESVLATGLGVIFGYVGVYLTPNKSS
jgi:hypothetical protein